MLEQMRRSKAGQSVTSNRRQATRKHGHPTGLPKGEGVFPEGHLPSRPPKPAPDGRTDGRTGMREGRLHRGSGCRTGLRARTPFGDAELSCTPHAPSWLWGCGFPEGVPSSGRSSPRGASKVPRGGQRSGDTLDPRGPVADSSREPPDQKASCNPNQTPIFFAYLICVG